MFSILRSSSVSVVGMSRTKQNKTYRTSLQKEEKKNTLVHTCSTNRRATSSTGSSSEERHYRIQLVPFNSPLSGTTLQNHFMYMLDVAVHEWKNSSVCELNISHESTIKVSSKINGHQTAKLLREKTWMYEMKGTS